MWRRLLLRAAIKGCGIVVVTVNEIDGAVRLLRESNVADEWPGRKLTFHRGLEAPAFQLGIEKLANADLRDDLVGANFDLHLGWITAVAFAWKVLREVSKEPKITGQWNATTCVRVRTYEEDEQSDQQIDCFHWPPPNLFYLFHSNFSSKSTGAEIGESAGFEAGAHPQRRYRG